jgi:hypothetical protein
VAHGATIKVEGARELRASMKRAGFDMQDLKSAHVEVAQYVGAVAASRAPRRSGMLAASWRPGAGSTQAVIRFGGAAVPYANAVHWGTGARAGLRGPHNIAPSLFATSAAHDTEPVWVDVYLDAVNAIVDTIRGA